MDDPMDDRQAATLPDSEVTARIALGSSDELASEPSIYTDDVIVPSPSTIDQTDF